MLKKENIDLNEKSKEEIVASISKAVEEGNAEGQVNGMVDLMNYVAYDAAQKVVRARIESESDSAILTARGVKQLTSEEKKYFNDLIKYMKDSQSLETIPNVMPETSINRIYEDLEAEHEILGVVDFQNVTGIVETIIRTGDVQSAVWGPLNDEIRKQLDSGFQKRSVNLYKLSAYLPVAKAYLDLGPDWLETFIRRMIVESLSMGLEGAIVNGDGKECPIGMNRDLAGNVVEGVYPKKTAIAIKNLKPATYGALLALLSNNGKRKIKEVILVVNPYDYFTKIYPAITILNSMGSYISNVLPFPTKIIQCPDLEQGEAVFGVGKKYFMGLGSNQKIEKSDEYRFLEDERVYVGKMYGNGFPKDNVSFLTLDITEMEALTMEVVVTDADENEGSY